MHQTTEILVSSHIEEAGVKQIDKLVLEDQNGYTAFIFFIQTRRPHADIRHQRFRPPRASPSTRQEKKKSR
jgi:hypothetical protein